MKTITFAWPELLWLLALLPLLIVLYIWLLRRKSRSAVRYANLGMIKEAMGVGARYRRHVPPVLFLLAIALLIVAMARPSATIILPSQKQTIVMALDASGSMRAKDVLPSRLEAAQAAAKQFVADLPAKAQVGIVTFAATATLVQTPTNDREAIYAIQQELEKFPGDITGHMMLAQIQFEDMKDIDAAQLTLQRLCAHAGMPGPVIATSLNTLADWQLKLHNLDAAREALEEIVTRLPDTEQAMLAQQRIAHLASRETLLDSHEHRPIAMKVGIKDIGLMKGPGPALVPQVDPVQRAEQLTQHLEQYPADNEAREKLAMIYAEHYQRLDLALEQLEQLIAAPNQPGREVARWLNVMADLQIQHGSDYEGAHVTLERVIERFPDLAAAQLAQQRIELLRLEVKGKEKSQVVKLGSYEKDLGLKQTPKRP